MTEVPYLVAVVLPPPSPRCPGETDALTELLRSSASAAAACSSHAGRAAESLEAARGQAARALTNKSTQLQAGAALVEQSASSAVLATQTYAVAVAEIHAAARAIEGEVASLLTRIREAVSTISEIANRNGIANSSSWRTPPPSFMPPGPESGAAETVTLTGDADSFNWSIASATWAGGLAGIDDACTRWRALVTAREAAERALTGALTRMALIDSGNGAGGGSATSTVAAMTALLTRDRPWELAEVRRLLSGELGPEQAAETWRTFVARGADVDGLIERYSVELAGIDGLPFTVRDRAARVALEYALTGDTELARVFTRLGLSPEDMTLREFRRDLIAVRDAVSLAEDRAQTGEVVQLAMLGSHDGVVTAAVSIGNLDEAAGIGVFVSGMNSSVRGLADSFEGFWEIHRRSGGSAMVTWAGYRSPTVGEELFQNRAERGSWPLATFLAGATESRADAPPDRFVLLGHSYGTNVAAEALKLGHHSVDAFVSIGSAGLKFGTASEGLGVSEIHATQAAGDNIAPVGQNAHVRATENGGPGYLPRVDPRDLTGADVFSSEKSELGRRVTMHNLLNPIDWGNGQWLADGLDGVASADEVGYLDPTSTTVRELFRIMRGEE